MTSKSSKADTSVTSGIAMMLRRRLSGGDSLSAAISAVSADLNECVQVATEQVLRERSIQEALSLPPTVPCACGRSRLQLNGRARTRTMDLTCGPVTYQRAYYAPSGDCSCPGRFPLDESLRLPRGALDPGIVEALALLAVLMPFEQAVKLLERILGVRLSKKRAVATVSLLADTALKQLSARAKRRWSSREELVLKRPPPGQRKGRLFIAVDGTCIGIRNSESFKESKAAVLFWENDLKPRRKRKRKGAKKRRRRQGDRDLKRKYIVSHVGSHQDFRSYLWDAFVEMGGLKAEQLVVLADGAEWIWNDIDLIFPSESFDVVELLDWYHLFENLWKAARALFVDETEQARWIGELKRRQRIRDTGRSIEAELQRQLAQPLSAQQRDTVERVLNYVYANSHRMRYAYFRHRGWPRGSAAIESVNHGVIQARFKLPGMRWTVEGANRMLNLRCAYFSGRWDAVFASAMEEHLHKPGGHKTKTKSQSSLWRSAA